MKAKCLNCRAIVDTTPEMDADDNAVCPKCGEFGHLMEWWQGRPDVAASHARIRERHIEHVIAWADNILDTPPEDRVEMVAEDPSVLDVLYVAVEMMKDERLARKRGG